MAHNTDLSSLKLRTSEKYKFPEIPYVETNVYASVFDEGKPIDRVIFSGHGVLKLAKW